MIRTYTLLITFILLINFRSAAQFASVIELEPVPVSVPTSTGEKPQSKVWSYGGRFWAVLANNTGTHLWRLDGTTWTPTLRLSSNNSTKADCKLVENVVHILLFQGRNSELVSIEYVPAANTYQFWSGRSSATPIQFERGVETATIEVDGTGRMWLASDGGSEIYAHWSDPPYQTWSSAIRIASGVSDDDISAIIALPGKIGILWSNQNTRRFGFRTHTDGAPPTAWSVDEVPASQSAVDVGEGMADDHLNMVVSQDGTLYAAVKTSYDHPDHPLVSLLIRRPSGAWDNIYDIARKGTRPIVLLDEANNKLIVVYTSREGGGNIVYRESAADHIEFGETFMLMAGNYNNATSTKDPFRDEIVILASNNSQVVGVIANSPIIPLPVELVSFTARFSNGDAVLHWVTASEQDNEYFSVEVSTDGRNFNAVGQVPGKGTTQLRSTYSFTDHNIYRYRSGTLYYRLRQVDFSGEEEFSPVRAVQLLQLAQAFSLQAYPNPFAAYLELQVSSVEEEVANFLIYDLQGKELLSVKKTLQVGLNKFVLHDLPQADGVYLLVVRTASQQKVVRILRQQH